MATSHPSDTDNWMLAAVGLKYLKEGLEEFTDQNLKQQHQDFLNALPAQTGQCVQCTIDNILPNHNKSSCKSKLCFCKDKQKRRLCPSGQCSQLCDLIVSSHRTGEPNWTNTGPNNWYSNHTSIGTCFINTPGYKFKKSISEIDLSGLLSIIINNVYFDQMRVGGGSIGSNNLFKKARDARNEILHEPTIQLLSGKMQNYISLFIKILTVPTIHQTPAAQAALEKLTEIQNGHYLLHKAEEDEILKLEEKATAEIKAAASFALAKIDDSGMECIKLAEKKIETKTDQAVSAVQQTSQQLSRRIDTMAEQADAAIEQTSQTLCQRIDIKTEQAVAAIEKSSKSPPHRIDTKTEQSVAVVEQTLQTLYQRLDTKTEQAVVAVQQASLKSSRRIDMKTEDAVATVQQASQRSNLGIGRRKAKSGGFLSTWWQKRKHTKREKGKRYKEEIEEKHKHMPDELGNDPYTQELYERAIQEGTENDNTVRVMVIGCYGQGKTSLVRRLLKQSIEGVEITSGIDLHRCAIINDTNWAKLDSEDPEEDSIRRLANIAKHDRKLSHHGSFEIEDEASSEFCDLKDTGSNNSNMKYEEATRVLIGLSITDKSDADFTNRERSSTRHEMTTVNNTSVNRPKIDYQTLKKFQTELKRVESGEDERKHRKAILNIWDFGGQFVYYATHQIFHSKQAVYILVFNVNIGLDTVVKDDEFPLHKKTMRDYLKFWISSVNSFVGSEGGYIPPIILVGTHTDKLQESVEVYDYFEEVRKMFDGSSCLNHIQPDHFAVSNKDSSEEDIDQLRESITRIGQNQLQTSVPAKWILLEKTLKMKKRKKIVSLDDVIEIDSLTDSPIQTQDRKESVDQIKLFFSYHHAKGTFCYFDDSKLSEHVVLDPQFLIDAFRCIITSEKFCKVRPRLRGLWSELCNKAVLRPKLLEEVWTQSDDQDFIQYKALLIEYMQRHRIISEVVAYDPNSEFAFKPLGYYIVPSFLKVSDDGSMIDSFCKGKGLSEVSLGYVLENGTMAPVLFQTTIAALIGRWPLISFNAKDIMYDNVVACELMKDHAGVLMLKDGSMELLVVNLCPPDGVRAEVCDMFRRYVEVVINTDMHKLHGKTEGRRFVKHLTVRCFHEDHGSTGSNGIYVIEEMQSCPEEKRSCPDKKNHCLRFENIKKEWFLHEVESENVPRRNLTSREYSTLSMAIGRGWQQLGLHLGLDCIAIEHIEMNKQTADMQIYAMLQSWDKKEADGATLDVLVHAIRECSREHVSVNWDVLKNIINGF